MPTLTQVSADDPDDVSREHSAQETDRTLVVAVQTRDQLKAAMAKLNEYIDVLQTEIDVRRSKRGSVPYDTP